MTPSSLCLVMNMVKESSGRHFVYAIFTGSEEEVRSDIAWYFREYPKPGYSTEITQDPTYLGGDIWEAKVRRYTTCG